MTGFIGRLFGSKDEAPAPAKKERPAAAPSPKDAFFLDTDSASGMGDVEYMRTVKKVKRTYARTVDSPDHVEQVKEISALNGKISVGNNGSTAPTSASEPQPSVPQNNETQQRRRSDSSMDMFRNMAKDIRK
jgi:hypothetical protein